MTPQQRAGRARETARDVGVAIAPTSPFYPRSPAGCLAGKIAELEFWAAARPALRSRDCSAAGAGGNET
eukprot:7824044-Pyramimonas_sp.AAC.1